MSTVVLGMGGWGTALANLLASDGRDVFLWGRDPERVEAVKHSRRNETYLPQIELKPSVHPTSDLNCVNEARLVVFVVPSRATREIAVQTKKRGVSGSAVLVSGTKGFEFPSGKRMSQVLSDVFPTLRVAALSGPNHAEEVGLGMPTASVLGSDDAAVLEDLQRTFSTGAFRTYTNQDVTGVELGGALKNIYALGAGIGDGLRLGDNSKAALVTRCLAEMVRVGVSLGGKRDTFYGLSGLGDLMVTCFSQHSRNRSVGERLGKGESLAQIRASMKAVAEGVPTTETSYAIARQIGVVTPVLDQIYAVLFENKPPRDAIKDLMSRELRSEEEDPARRT